MSHLSWQKSSFSSGDPNTTCVQVADGGDATLHMRESVNPTVTLTAPHAALRALLVHLKCEEHERG